MARFPSAIRESWAMKWSERSWRRATPTRSFRERGSSSTRSSTAAHVCPNGMLIGRDTNGGFAEYVTAPRSHVFRLPDSIDSRTAPLIQVLTTCLHAQRQVNICPAESVVVFGLGVTGQLHVQLAKE